MERLCSTLFKEEWHKALGSWEWDVISCTMWPDDCLAFPQGKVDMPWNFWIRSYCCYCENFELDPNTEASLSLYKDSRLNHHLLSLKCLPIMMLWLSKWEGSRQKVRRKRSTPIEVKAISSSKLMVHLKDMVTRRKVIKEKEDFSHGELQSITVTVVFCS